MGESEQDRGGEPTRADIEAALQRAVLDALSNHVAVLDERGVIIAVNRAWKQLGDNNGLSTDDYGVGSSYLGHCAAAARDGDEGAVEALDGLQRMLAGIGDRLHLTYPCHSPTEERWFRMTVTRVSGGGASSLVVSHENVSDYKRVEASLRKLSRAVDASPVSVVVTDRAGRV